MKYVNYINQFIFLKYTYIHFFHILWFLSGDLDPSFVVEILASSPSSSGTPWRASAMEASKLVAWKVKLMEADGS